VLLEEDDETPVPPVSLEEDDDVIPPQPTPAIVAPARASTQPSRPWTFISEPPTNERSANIVRPPP
jgi:hypothetical protein